MRVIANYLVTTSLVVLAAFAATPAQAANLEAIVIGRRRHGLSRRRQRHARHRGRSSRRRQHRRGQRFSARARPLVAAGRGRGGCQTHDRRDRCQDAARRIASRSARTRQAHRGAEGPARTICKARSMPPTPAASSPSILPRQHQPESATRARRARSRNGARPLPRCRTKSPRAEHGGARCRAQAARPRSRDRAAAIRSRHQAAEQARGAARSRRAGATTAKLRVTYNVRNARWTPLYDARLDTGARDRKPALELVRRAEITQSTGEDWSNVALSVSTVRTARGGNAPELNSLIVRYPEPPPQASSAPLPAAPLQSLQRPPIGRSALAAPFAMKKAEEQRGRGRYRRLPGRVPESRVASASVPAKAPKACASRPRRSCPILSCARCRCSIRPPIWRRASSRARMRRCCRVGSRSIATARSSGANR